MGWLRKKAKQIGKGIKKVFKKIGKAIGKLGVVGQIGMMFLMPYAMGALSSFQCHCLITKSIFAHRQFFRCLISIVLLEKVPRCKAIDLCQESSVQGRSDNIPYIIEW